MTGKRSSTIEVASSCSTWRFYENDLAERLPSDAELLWVADQLIGDRRTDPRSKLVQFILQGITSGLYAVAKMDAGPVEINRQPFSLFDDPQ